MDKEFQLVYLSISELSPAEYNPREISPHDFEALKHSLQEFGFVDPVICRMANKAIIGGHKRVEAAIALGIKKVPVILTDVTEEQAKILNLALNRISGEWDKDKLKALFIDLNNLQLDLTLTGFESEEISQLLDFTKEDNYKAPEDLPTRTVLGEVWLLGNHRVMCGDATKKEDVEKLMDGKKVQVVFTDPPYNVDYESPAGGTYAGGKYVHSKIFNDNLSEDQYGEFLTNALKNGFAATNDSMSIYLFFAGSNYPVVRKAFESAGFHYSQMLIWCKDRFVLAPGSDFHRMFEPIMYGWKEDKKHWFNQYFANASDVITLEKEEFLEQLDVWYEHRDDLSNYVHPTQKPVRLAERGLKKSTKPEDGVLDLFGGSGSTLIACEQMNRNCYMMELDPYYCDVILDRWEKFTGKTAQKL